MQCADVRQQMAIYRELDEAARFLVHDHLDTCAECRAAFEAYQEQDRLLANLPGLTPSPALAQAVARRTTRRSASPTRRSASPTDRPALSGARRWAGSLAAAALAMVMISFTTLSVAAGSLPGDALYPLKRAAERARLALTANNESRARYLAQLAAQRRDEVARLLHEGREGQVLFEGRLEATAEGQWVIEGIPVVFDANTLTSAQDAARWADNPPATAEVLVIEARVTGGRVVAERVLIATPVVLPTGAPNGRPTRTPTPAPSATASLTPTSTSTSAPSPTLTSAPTDEPTADEPSARPEREGTRTPRVGATRTPRRGANAETPTPRVTWTLRPSATPKDTATPRVTRTPQPTRAIPTLTSVPTRRQEGTPTPPLEPTRRKPTREPTRARPTERPTRVEPTARPEPTDEPPTPRPPTPKPPPTDAPAWPTPKPPPTEWPTPRKPTERPFPTADEAPRP